MKNVLSILAVIAVFAVIGVFVLNGNNYDKNTSSTAGVDEEYSFILNETATDLPEYFAGNQAKAGEISSLWTDTVHPMILVSKATTWPTHHRHLDVLQSLQHIVAVTLSVRNLRVRTNPQTTIDTCTQVLSKLTVDLLIDFLHCIVHLQGH